MKKGKKRGNFRSSKLSGHVNFFKFLSFLTAVSVSLFCSFSSVSGTGDAPVYAVPVLVLKFFPLDGTGKLDRSIVGTGFPEHDRPLSSIRAKVSRLNSRGISFMERASRYKGYKDSNAVSSIGPVILDEIEYLEPVPVALNFDGSTPRTNKIAYLNRANICDYVNNRGVEQVWVWMYHSNVVEPVESNMAMGTNVMALWNHNGYGDVSNSNQLKDLPVCKNTYTVYEFNYARGLGEMTEDFGHQIERLLNHADSSLFWDEFVGGGSSHERIIDPGCGSVHYTPNSNDDYDWYNRRNVLSNCEDWKPDGSGTKRWVNCETWGGSRCPDDGGVAWKTWWMQNIPGEDNGLSYNGANLRNWWHFFGNFDEALSYDRSLTETAGPVITNSLPWFSGSSFFSVPENGRSVGTVVAYDGDGQDGVTGYRISDGADRARFSITNVGVLTFFSAPNYERPIDSGGNNVYNLVVTVTSGSGSRVRTATRAITVTVTDVNEVPSRPFAPVLSSSTPTSLFVRWSAPFNTGFVITDYDVEYRRGTTGSFRSWPHSGSGTSTTITGLSAGTLYEVRVLARNVEGDSLWSFTSSFTTGLIVTNSPPTFYSSRTFSVPENGRSVGTVVAYDGDSRDSVTGYRISGGADSSLFWITNAGVLSFRSAPDFEFPSDAGRNNVYSLLVTATSGSGSRVRTATQTITVTVIDVNEAPSRPFAPVLSSPTPNSLSVRWSAPLNTGPAISDYDVDSSLYRPGTSVLFRSWPHSGSGASTTITGLSAGTWYYVRVLARNVEGDSLWSFTSSFTTGSAVVNNPPAFTSSSFFSVNENTVSVGTVVAYDGDSRDSVTGYRISGGADSSLFWITNAGVLSFRSAPDFEFPSDAGTNNQYLVDVTVTSGVGSRERSATRTYAVGVIDVNEAPSRPSAPVLSSPTPNSLSVSWSAPLNTGPVITGYGVEYRRGTTGLFRSWPHSGSGASTTITGLSHSTLYQVRVLARNVEGDGIWSFTSSFTTGLTVTNSPPIFSGGRTFSVPENSRGVGAVVAFDGDGQDGVTGYRISGGLDGSLFSITNAGILTFDHAPDYEAPSDAGTNNAYLVEITVTSGVGSREGSATRTYAVSVIDVNEAPLRPSAPVLSSPTPNSLSVSWFAPLNTGPAISDYDVEYRQGTTGQFSNWPHSGSGTSTMITGLSAGTLYDVQVLARNVEGDGIWSFTSSFTTGLTVTNNSPTFSSSPTFSVPENGRRVGAVVAFDGYGQDGVTGYRISGGSDISLFSITNAGILTFDSAPNHEAPSDAGRNNVYALLVTATSGIGAREKSETQTILVTVTDVNESPSAPSPPSLSVPTSTSVFVSWSAPSNTGSVITDYDVEYGKNSNNFFSDWLHSNASARTTITGLDKNTLYLVRVRARNDEGVSGWSDMSSASTGSVAANNPPAFTGSSTFSVQENGVNVGTVVASDSDAEDRITGYSVSGGADRSLFRINSGGVLSFHSTPDFESPSDAGRNNEYVVEVTVTSGTGVRERSATERIAVRVKNVNKQDAENSTGNYSGDDSVKQSGNGFFRGVIIYLVISVVVTILFMGGAIIFINMRSDGLSYEDVEDPHDVGGGYSTSGDDPDGRK